MGGNLQGRTEISPGKLIVGLGRTGLSCARYFAARGEDFLVTDSRTAPPGLDQFRSEFPQHRLELGGFNQATFLAADALVVSPGVSLETPEIVIAMGAGVPVTGDIDIFSQVADRPVVAITGSNGKSTVTALIAEIFAAAGISFGLGGNFEGAGGQPALDLLPAASPDIYLLELSSFQLETTARLGAEVSTILNLSEDHMDRYRSMQGYLQAKQRVFLGSRQVVVNQDDPYSHPPADSVDRIDKLWTYGQSSDAELAFGLMTDDGDDYLLCRGEKLLPVSALKLVGQHNVVNVLAAMTVSHAAGVELSAIRQGVQQFAGLPNRCQWVACINGVDYYNDSKGTNVGATLAAVAGLGEKLKGRIVLIAGGMGKGADFRPLIPALRQWARAVVLIGIDGPRMATAIGHESSCVFAVDLPAAVEAASELAQPGDAVLLSPACASFDMFRDFNHRGEVFIESVRRLI